MPIALSLCKTDGKTKQQQITININKQLITGCLVMGLPSGGRALDGCRLALSSRPTRVPHAEHHADRSAKAVPQLQQNPAIVPSPRIEFAYTVERIIPH